MTFPYGLLDDPSSLPGPQMTPSNPPLPPVSAAPLPAAPAKPSLWQRVQQILMPQPAGTDGILSPDDIANARRQALLQGGLSLLANSRSNNYYQPVQSTGAALAGAAGATRGGFQDALTGMLSSRENAMALQHQMALNKLRDTLAQQPQDPNESPADRIERITNMALDYANAGDPDTAGKLAALAKALHDSRVSPDKFQSVQAGDAIYTFDPRTGTYTKGPARGMPADEIELRKQTLAEQMTRAKMAEDAREEQLDGSTARAFMTQNQKLADTEQKYETAKSAFAEARAGNSAALKSAIMDFAAAADPNAQMRASIINMVMKVDPSVKGSFSMALDRLISGTLPPYVVNDMEALVDRVHSSVASIYDRRRAEAVKNRPSLERWIPSTMAELGAGAGASTGASGGGNSNNVRQFLPR